MRRKPLSAVPASRSARWLIILISILLTPSPALADWRVATTPHFQLYADSSESEIRRHAERLEQVDALMRTATGARETIEPYRVRVFFLDDADDVRRVGHLSGNYSGYYRVTESGPIAVVPRGTGSRQEGFGPEVTLIHEYAHHFMLQYFPAAYPAWYVEGWAELFSTSRREGDSITYGRAAQGRGYDLYQGDWMPIDLLMNARVGELPERSTGSFYAQAWLLTHYLTFSKERSGQLSAYIAAINSGRAPKEAQAAFGDLEQLDKDLRDYKRDNEYPYQRVSITPLAEGAISVRPASAGEAALIEQAIMERSHVPENERAEWLADIRARAAPYLDDPFALQLLADAEYAADDFAAADATAGRLLAIRPGDPRALTRQGLARLALAASAPRAERETRIKEARGLIVKANRAAPEDPLPLIAYFRSFAETGDPMPDIAIEGLAKAVVIIPQDQGLRLTLAHALIGRAKPELAITVLKPVAFAAHPSPAQGIARALIDRLESGELTAAN